VTRGKEIYSLQDHRATTSKVKAETKKQKEATHKLAFAAILDPLPRILSRTLVCGIETGAWLSVLPSTIAGTELSSDELCDSLHIQYGRTPAGLQATCDGCGTSFNTRHALSCAKGGLVIIMHNELRDKLYDMASRAFQPSTVGDKPKNKNVAPPKPDSPVRQWRKMKIVMTFLYEDYGEGVLTVSWM
jgi:hypothetical protein